MPYGIYLAKYRYVNSEADPPFNKSEGVDFPNIRKSVAGNYSVAYLRMDRTDVVLCVVNASDLSSFDNDKKLTKLWADNVAITTSVKNHPLYQTRIKPEFDKLNVNDKEQIFKEYEWNDWVDIFIQRKTHVPPITFDLIKKKLERPNHGVWCDINTNQFRNEIVERRFLYNRKQFL